MKGRLGLLGISGPILGLMVGLSLGLLLTLFFGENPLLIASVLYRSAFGTLFDFGLTLFYTTPLIFTGLSVALAFRAGLFNIGAEGQLTVAALAVAVLGVYGPEVSFLPAMVLSLLVASFAGGLWGALAGWLRAYRGSHEVIVTIMMNFIAAALTAWLVTDLLQSKESQSPETSAMMPGYQWREFDPIGRVFDGAPVGVSLFLAIATALFTWFLLFRTKWGYRLRATGEGERAASVAGFSVKSIQWQAMALAGLLAGLVAIPEVVGHAGKFRLGFSPAYGFTGIAVALLARNHPLAVLATAFLFGALHKGAADLDIETEKVSRDLAVVIQAFAILAVAVFQSRLAGRRK
jgi:general nucleoside transport system permease protein